VGSGNEWTLPSHVPVDEIAEDSRRAGDPCHALVSIGVTPEGDDLFVDLEAAGILHVGGAAETAVSILRAIATSLSVAGHAEACHLIGGESVTVDLGTPNSHVTDSVDSGVELASGLVGGTRQQELTSFELRARRTGSDIWEPAVLLLDESLRPDDQTDDESARWPGDTAQLFAPAHGLALVTTLVPPGADARWSLEPQSEGWLLSTTVGRFRVDPIGLREKEATSLGVLMETAARAPVEDELEWAPDGEPFDEPPHDIVVSLFGGIAVTDHSGNTASFSRSKSVELLAWLVTHRDRSTRTAARTALWDLDVRDATFANVVSEARRTLARLVTPPEGEWLARTLTEDLPLDHRVVSDSELVSARLDHARGVRDHDDAIEVLRPVLDLIADAPFAGTDYLWPDAEGITSNLVLLAVGACTELARRALHVGDIETLFAATDRGLRVLPGHEEMIALRMRAHAQAGDPAGVKQEWASYERAILADPWSDGEPAPRLQAVRAELLGQAR
jgi:DNA-binding SARP family transcriptional activator